MASLELATSLMAFFRTAQLSEVMSVKRMIQLSALEQTDMDVSVGAICAICGSQIDLKCPLHDVLDPLYGLELNTDNARVVNDDEHKNENEIRALRMIYAAFDGPHDDIHDDDDDDSEYEDEDELAGM